MNRTPCIEGRGVDVVTVSIEAPPRSLVYTQTLTVSDPPKDDSERPPECTSQELTSEVRVPAVEVGEPEVCRAVQSHPDTYTQGLFEVVESTDEQPPV